jgi:hypothetical protein
VLTQAEARAAVEQHGSKRAAAKALGVPRSTFYHWLDPEPGRKRAREWYESSEENREHHRQKARDWYENASGFQLNRRRLQIRRIKALRRIKQRREEREVLSG